MQLYGRRVVVQLGTTTTPGKEYADLRVQFRVEADDSSTPNKAKIEIYNLAQDTIADMQRDDAVVRLLAGYRSAPLRQLFQGNPVRGGAHLDRRGTDRVLVLEAQDGGRDYTARHVSQSYTTPTTSRQMFAALADQLGLPLGYTAGVKGDVSFPHGLVLQGRVADQLDRVADLSGARWQIRDGALQVWPDDGSTGEAAVLFSADAGNLIGSPSVTDQGVEITALLAPTLRPGKPFRVESEYVQGDYVATEVVFRGDSGFATDFYVVAKGRAL